MWTEQARNVHHSKAKFKKMSVFPAVPTLFHLSKLVRGLHRNSSVCVDMGIEQSLTFKRFLELRTSYAKLSFWTDNTRKLIFRMLNRITWHKSYHPLPCRTFFLDFTSKLQKSESAKSYAKVFLQKSNEHLLWNKLLWQFMTAIFYAHLCSARLWRSHKHHNIYYKLTDSPQFSTNPNQNFVSGFLCSKPLVSSLYKST